MSAKGRHLRFRTHWLAVGWGLAALLLVLSLMPAPVQPFRFGWSDKLEHALAYGLLMGWFMQIHATRAERARVALGLLLLGVAAELMQATTATRFFEAADMAANATGVLLAWAALRPPWTEILWRVEQLFAPR